MVQSPRLIACAKRCASLPLDPAAQTALKLAFWSFVLYDHLEVPGSIYTLEAALQLYRLQRHELLWEKEHDVKCLVAWNDDTVSQPPKGRAACSKDGARLAECEGRVVQPAWCSKPGGQASEAALALPGAGMDTQSDGSSLLLSLAWQAQGPSFHAPPHMQVVIAFRGTARWSRQTGRREGWRGMTAQASSRAQQLLLAKPPVLPPAPAPPLTAVPLCTLPPVQPGQREGRLAGVANAMAPGRGPPAAGHVSSLLGPCRPASRGGLQGPGQCMPSGPTVDGSRLPLVRALGRDARAGWRGADPALTSALLRPAGPP